MKLKILFILSITPLLLVAKAKEPQYLKITKVKQSAVKIGGKAGDAIVTVTIGVGLHIQANPAGQPNLIATELKVEPKEDFLVETPVYPAGKPYRLQNSDRDLSTYDGVVEIKVPVKALGNAKPGKAELTGKLRFQPCNDKICFFPTSVPVTIPVQVCK